MNRINHIGSNLIEYKREYLKHISPIIDEALLIALETMIDKKLLDLEAFELIKDDEVTLEDFTKKLSLRSEYTKTSRELFFEFEKVRSRVNKHLLEISFTSGVETESNVEGNRISVFKQYSIGKEFIMEFFGVNEKELIQLMKKKGFVEKYAVLRLNKVFKEIYNSMEKEEYISQGYSLVYFNSKITGFSVDYKYHMNVDFISNEGNMRGLLKRIKELDKLVNKQFLERSGLNLYDDLEPIRTVSIEAEKGKSDANSDFEVPLDAPINKIKEASDVAEVILLEEEFRDESKKEEDKVIVIKESPKKGEEFIENLSDKINPDNKSKDLEDSKDKSDNKPKYQKTPKKNNNKKESQQRGVFKVVNNEVIGANVESTIKDIDDENILIDEEEIEKIDIDINSIELEDAISLDDMDYIDDDDLI